ncbi:MAG: 30S ribosomal protein S9, partial [Bacillota bacterium]|nr:30S ribosomal protein S9 [Bacillota bacterium]
MAIQFMGTGRRKKSIARVRLIPGTGDIKINGRELDNYFPYELLTREVKRPLQLVGVEAKYDVIVRVNGGGFTGQAGAIRQGIARALVKSDETLKSPLKAEGFLTRDSRMKERKKYGLKKARRSPQFS